VTELGLRFWDFLDNQTVKTAEVIEYYRSHFSSSSNVALGS
jgi:hypothetical protein